MKQFLIFLGVIATSNLTYGQEFSFEMYFEDSLGNKDTLIMGYDILATDTIDSIFGEINIVSVPLDSVFGVRITNEWYSGGYETFHTKKQIVSYNCVSWPYTIVTVDIKTKNWPVTASWDDTVFYDTCRNGSVFTSVNPGGWWDTGSPSNLDRVQLKHQNQVTFSIQVETYSNGSFNDNYAYSNGIGDTLSVFWVGFGDLY